MLYRVDGEQVAEVEATSVVGEGLYEKDVEDWVAQRPDILGEDLLVIGRQVQLDEGKDWIDVLTIDKAGSLVIVELKRDLVGGQADLQALRYAALVGQWTFEDVRRQAEGHWKTIGAERGTFAQEIEDFADEGYEVNGAQRVILAGRDVKPRLGTMALWLRGQGLDVRVVSVELFRDADSVYVQPQVVIPPPAEERFERSAQIGSSDRPWRADGEKWHKEQRASAAGRVIIEALVDVIEEAAPEASGPNWNQKFYISWKHGSHLWTTISTGSPNVEYLHLKGLDLTPAEVAERLGWEEFDVEAELSEKFGLGSSVASHKDGGLRFIVKVADDVARSSEPLRALIQEAWIAFSAGGA